MESFEINEKDLLNNKLNTCFDVIMQDDFNSEEYLDEDNQDNILLVRKFITSEGVTEFKVSCYTRSSLKEIIKFRREPPYISKSCRTVSGEFETFYPINIGEVECFFIKTQIEDMIRGTHQIYYVSPKEGENRINCQGRTNTIYTIKVCGGENCLPQIFRENESEEEYESDEDEESDEEDESDVEPDESEEEQRFELFVADLNSYYPNDLGNFRETLNRFHRDIYPTRGFTLSEYIPSVIYRGVRDDFMEAVVDKLWPDIQSYSYIDFRDPREPLKSPLHHLIDEINEQNLDRERIKDILLILLSQNEYLIDQNILVRYPDGRVTNLRNPIQYAQSINKPIIASILREIKDTVNIDEIEEQKYRINDFLHTDFRDESLENYIVKRIASRLMRMLDRNQMEEFKNLIDELMLDSYFNERIIQRIIIKKLRDGRSIKNIVLNQPSYENIKTFLEERIDDLSELIDEEYILPEDEGEEDEESDFINDVRRAVDERDLESFITLMKRYHTDFEIAPSLPIYYIIENILTDEKIEKMLAIAMDKIYNIEEVITGYDRPQNRSAGVPMKPLIDIIHGSGIEDRERIKRLLNIVLEQNTNLIRSDIRVGRTYYDSAAYARSIGNELIEEVLLEILDEIDEREIDRQSRDANNYSLALGDDDERTAKRLYMKYQTARIAHRIKSLLDQGKIEDIKNEINRVKNDSDFEDEEDIVKIFFTRLRDGGRLNEIIENSDFEELKNIVREIVAEDEEEYGDEEEEDESEDEEEDEDEDELSNNLYGPGEEILNTYSSNTNMNLFRNAIIQYEEENPDNYPTITLLRKIEDLVVNNEEDLSKNIAILVDKFGPLLLTQEFEGKNNLQYLIDFINEEEHSNEQIEAWLDLLLLGNEYLINSLPEINLIEYSLSQNKNRTADILRQTSQNAQNIIPRQLTRHNQLKDRLGEDDYPQIRFDILNSGETSYQKMRIMHRLIKLLREGNRSGYNKVLRELKLDEGIGIDLAEEIDEEISEILGDDEDEEDESEGEDEEDEEEDEE